MTLPLRHLRDGSVVGAWVLKASPAIWDIGAALDEQVDLDWWRLAPSYRVALVRAGDPCAMWVTKGDPRVSSGFWAVGTVVGEPFEDVGDPEDTLWRDEHARRQVRPRVPIQMEVLETPIERDAVLADPRLRRTEIVRVPRIGNPAAMTPEEWMALDDLIRRP